MDFNAYLVLLFFPCLMVYAAFSDLFSMTISNRISLCLAVGFIFFAWKIGMSWETLKTHLMIFGIVFSIGFVAFALNLFGGGDVKLIASTSLWLGSATLPYLLVSSFIGAALAILLLKFRATILPPRLYQLSWVKQLHQDNFGMPYGIALGAGAMVTFPTTPWMEHVIARSIG